MIEDTICLWQYKRRTSTQTNVVNNIQESVFESDLYGQFVVGQATWQMFMNKK